MTCDTNIDNLAKAIKFKTKTFIRLTNSPLIVQQAEAGASKRSLAKTWCFSNECTRNPKKCAVRNLTKEMEQQNV